MDENIYSPEVSTHNHTLVSSHAYSTLSEIMEYASHTNLKAVAITDHGPELPDGAPHLWHFSNMKSLPRKVCGLFLLRGAEANVINEDGEVDLPDDILNKLDIVIASIHPPSYARGSDATKTWLNIAKNPMIDIIGHSGSDNFTYDYEKVIKEFKRHDKIVEINSHSFDCRVGSNVNCKRIAELCKKYEVNIVISSDSHFASEVNATQKAEQMLMDIDFPLKLILNKTQERFFKWLYDKKGIIIE